MIKLNTKEIINPNSIYSHKEFFDQSNSRGGDQSPAHKVALQGNNNQLGRYAQPSTASRGPCTQVSHRKNTQIH